MPVTSYVTMNGELMGEITSGVRTDYLRDALGSVTGTVDSTGAVRNTYRYKPFGGLLSKTGSDPDPKYLWTGTTPSRTTGRSYSGQYNQARHYGSEQGQWTSVDRLWPWEAPYGYAHLSPVFLADPTGLSAGSSLGPQIDCLDNPCVNAVKLGLINVRDDESGFSLCYCGKAIPCVAPKAYNLDVEVRACILEHERCHTEIGKPCSPCGIYRQLTGPGGPDHDECLCHVTELMCYMRKLRRCGKTPKEWFKKCPDLFRAAAGLCADLQVSGFCERSPTATNFKSICGRFERLIR